MHGIGTECPVIAKTVILRKNSAFLSVMVKFSLKLKFVDKADPHMIIWNVLGKRTQTFIWHCIYFVLLWSVE